MRSIDEAANRSRFGQVVPVALATLLLAPPLWATTYTVNNPNDTQVSGQISLREALTAANTNAVSGGAAAGEASGDIINVTVPIAITQGEITISDDVTINLSAAVTVSGGSRAFNISAAAADVVNINNGSITGGSTVTNGGAILIGADSVVNIDGTAFTSNTSTGAARFEGGGAIWSAGTLTLTNANFTSNSVTGVQGNGGALLNLGTASITGGTFSGNTANRAGGGIENDVDNGSAGSITLTNVTLDSNTVGTAPGNGGGFHQAAGSVTVTGGTISNNTAGNEGGGLWAGGTSNITGTSITNNTANGTAADNGGGGLFNNGGTMTVLNATITGNQAVQGSASGGGVFNKANGMSNTLSMTGSTVSNNTTNRAGGGVEDNGGTVTLTNMTMRGNRALTSPGNGGAVHSSGPATVTINRGTYSGNTAAEEGGAIWTAGTATISNVTVQDNTAAGALADQGGGGLFNQGGNMTVRDSTISRNTASGTSGSGGGILSDGGDLLVEDSVISSNQANRAGGGIELSAAMGAAALDEVLMENNNAGIAPATANPGNGGAIHISGSNNIEIDGSRFSGNMAALEGGALWNSTGAMEVTASSITGNTSEGGAASHDGGGGIFNNGGSLLINVSDISNNIANGTLGSGGGILNATNGTVQVLLSSLNNNSASRAGGALEDNGGGTNVTMSAVTMSGNRTGSNPGNGGAVHITGAGAVNIIQSEVSGNTASNEGGGLWNFSTGTLAISNTTVSGNTSPKGGGIFQDGAGSDFSVADSTIANNSGPAIEIESGGSLALSNSIVAGTIIGSAAGNNNVIEVTSPVVTGTANTQGQSAQLGSLLDNGGPTRTHAISAGPAIDTAETAVCGSVPRASDQRGFTRPFDGDAVGGANCDAGAFEFANSPELSAASTTGTTGTAAPGATNVPGLGITVTNPSTNSSVMVNGFTGRIIAGRNTLAKLAGAKVFLDSNGNGRVDAADTDITGQSSPSFSATGGFFIVDFVPNRSLAAGASESYLIAVDFNAATSAGFGLLMLPLLALFAFRRKLRAFALAGLMAVGLSACGGGQSSPGLPIGGAGVDSANTLQFVATKVDVVDGSGSSAAIVRSLPVTGPLITVE